MLHGVDQNNGKWGHFVKSSQFTGLCEGKELGLKVGVRHVNARLRGWGMYYSMCMCLWVCVVWIYIFVTCYAEIFYAISGGDRWRLTTVFINTPLPPTLFSILARTPQPIIPPPPPPHRGLISAQTPVSTDGTGRWLIVIVYPMV